LPSQRKKEKSVRIVNVIVIVKKICMGIGTMVILVLVRLVNARRRRWVYGRKFF
jgi:hypothetical protein